MDFNLQDFRWPCDIGFRVEVHDTNHRLRNCTFDDDGNMIPRDLFRSADSQACFDHLRWQRPGGPFISFFTTWSAALQRRQWVIDRGATSPVIVAVYLRELLSVYDAYGIARALNLPDPNASLNEVLLHGGIAANSSRILAMFHGQTALENIALSTEGLVVMIRIPGDFILGVQTTMHVGTGYQLDCTERLEQEVYARTGARAYIKVLLLMLTMGNISYMSEIDTYDGSIVISWPLTGVQWRMEPPATG
ncbi:hypothetical protein QQS21_009495 [Conoideocrella luteorostrata]|uniref:Uncharacterized protein n=1 Tax=Conoideocrella luteorostrata TaxID=1105319 RepID=A0AAJ0CL72_9HYPO|nr:hypothetical protein QQS21_009495 [Conoideocrella luteorostrata]